MPEAVTTELSKDMRPNGCFDAHDDIEVGDPQGEKVAPGAGPIDRLY